MIRFGEVRAIGFHARGVECVRFGWGNVFSSGLDATIQSWDPFDGKDWNTLRTPDALQSLAANGNLLTALHALTLETLEEQGQLACGLADGPVTLLDHSTGRPVRSLEFEPAAFSKTTGFCALSVSADGKYLAGTNLSYGAVWSLEDGHLHWTSEKFAGGNALGFFERDLIIQPWSPLLMRVEWKSEGAVNDIHFKSLGGNFVTSRMGAKGSAMDMFVSQLIPSESAVGKKASEVDLGDDLEIDLDGTWNGELGSDGISSPRHASAKADSSVSTFAEKSQLLGLDLKSNRVAWQVQSDGRLHDIAVLPDGKHILTCGSNGRVDLWEIGGKSPLQTLDLSRAPLLRGLTSGRLREGFITVAPYLVEDFYSPHAVHTMALTPDGKQLAMGTAGGAVLVTDLG